MNNNNMIDCPCCNEKKQNLNTSVRYVDVKFKSEENQELFNNRKLILCTNCNFSYSLPFLSEVNLNDFYYNSFPKRRLRSMEINAKKSFSFNLISLQRIFFASAFLKSKEKLNILDFGGGDGTNAQQIKNLLPNADVKICDNKIYQNIWKVRNVNFKDLDDYDDKSIDFFFSSHTFEHINANDLNSLLYKIKKKLSNEAIIYIEVPNDNFIDFKDKEKINEGVHVCHFSKDSLSKLVSKYFQIIDINTRGEKRKLYEDEDNYKNFSKEKNILFRDRLKQFFEKIKILNFVHKILNFYYLYFHKINHHKKLVSDKFFHKTKDDNGSIIALIARNS